MNLFVIKIIYSKLYEMYSVPMDLKAVVNLAWRQPLEAGSAVVAAKTRRCMIRYVE